MCTSTISAWCRGTKPNGKKIISFRDPGTGKGEYIQIPCGKCIDCRLKYSLNWAIRMMNEASCYDSNCFITLTFNDKFLDPSYSLQKYHFRNFIKRLRKYLTDHKFSDSEQNCQLLGAVRQVRRVRYFHAAEYGETFQRPHHHAIIFNYDFPDKILKTKRNGFNYYESPILSKLWSDPKTKESYGFHEISDVSFDSCAYVARYILKKVNGEKEEEHYSLVDEQGNFVKREKEFCTMSRGRGAVRGIGGGWYQRYAETDVWAFDRMHVKGRQYMTPPRYYTEKLLLTDPKKYEIIKAERLKKVKDNADNRFERQEARGIVKEAQYRFLKRSLI